VEPAAALLAPLEREVVLGDLAETDCSVWRGLGDVLSLAMHRQLALWNRWRPWAASIGLSPTLSRSRRALCVLATPSTAESLPAGHSKAPADSIDLLSECKPFCTLCDFDISSKSADGGRESSRPHSQNYLIFQGVKLTRFRPQAA